MPFAATWMSSETIILSEVSQKDKNKYIWYHLYVEPKIWHKWTYLWNRRGFPGGLTCKKSTCQCRRCKGYKFDPWVGKILWRRKWQPPPAFLPGKFYGQKSLVGYSPWSPKESDTTKHTRILIPIWNRNRSQSWRTDLWLLRGRRVGEWESGRGEDWEFGISRYKLVYIGSINHKILVYSTGNYIPYPVKNIMEKNMKKNIYV